MKTGYVKCKCCDTKIYEGDTAYYNDGNYYCCSVCLAESCQCTIQSDDCKYIEEIDKYDVDAYNDDVKLRII